MCCTPSRCKHYLQLHSKILLHKAIPQRFFQVLRLISTSIKDGLASFCGRVASLWEQQLWAVTGLQSKMQIHILFLYECMKFRGPWWFSCPGAGCWEFDPGGYKGLGPDGAMMPEVTDRCVVTGLENFAMIYYGLARPGYGQVHYRLLVTVYFLGVKNFLYVPDHSSVVFLFLHTTSQFTTTSTYHRKTTSTTTSHIELSKPLDSYLDSSFILSRIWLSRFRCLHSR